MTLELSPEFLSGNPIAVNAGGAGARVRKSTPELTLDTESLRLSAALVPWDSESFNVPVAQLRHIKVCDRWSAHTDMKLLLAWLESEDVELASCRLDHAQLQESAALEEVGFRFIEMVYGMEIRLHNWQPIAGELPKVQFRRALTADLAELQVLAAAAFSTGRWNIDWSVGNALGGRRYADWVSRSLSNPRHQVLRAVVDGHTVGLFIIESAADGSVYWHLTAVAPRWQGHGLGKAMWTAMLRRHAREGAAQVRTTISARNVPVVNLYSRLGWRFVDCQMTYHWTSAKWLARRT